ncbi:MAG: hypothetical protein BWY76_02422 [bacterium ADurb.Bin429]|nr:MAG: hypothetical protein BWY76_02422 [bacterium ADurb.Bin429]
MLRIAATLAEHDSRHQRGDTRRNMYHQPAGEIQCAQLAQPATRAPHPVRQRVVHQRSPEDEKEQERLELHAFRHRAEDERGSNDGEHHLEGHEEQVRNGSSIRTRLAAHIIKAEEVQTTNNAADGRAKRERIAEQHPLNADHAHRHHAMHHRAQYVLATNHTTVEERQAWCHEQHHGGGDKHPRGVAGVNRRRTRLLCHR